MKIIKHPEELLKTTLLIVLLLSIPMLMAATPISFIPTPLVGQTGGGSWILNILLKIGEFFVKTELGQLVLQIGDAIIRFGIQILKAKILCPGHMITDPNDPLQGTFTGCFQFDFNGETCDIYRPRMFRFSINSPWELAPFEQDILMSKCGK